MITPLSVFSATRNRHTELLLLLVALFWGTTYGVTKSALLYTSIFLFMAIRFLLTFLILSYSAYKDFSEHKNTDWIVAIPTGLILLTIFCFEIAGISKTSATNAAFLISLSAILTASLEVLVNKKPLNVRLLMLSVFSVLGVCLLTYNKELSLQLNTGDGLILLAAMFRAIMVTTTKRFTQGKQITTLSLTALQSFIVGFGALILLLVQPSNVDLMLPTSWSFWAMMLYLVVCCTLFAFFVQNYAVRRTSPTKVALLMGSEPLFGALFAFAWLGESLSNIQYVGCFIILVTVYVAARD